jgi:phage terminase large subunit-like protein
MFDKEKADRAVQFIELLKHTKGQWAGVAFNLPDWQKQIVRDIFGTVNDDGRRQYRTAYIEIPRKNGKSELGAAIALYLLFGDKETGAEIYSAAADRDQAAIVFHVAAQMIRQAPALGKRSKIVDLGPRVTTVPFLRRPRPSMGTTRAGLSSTSCTRSLTGTCGMY